MFRPRLGPRVALANAENLPGQKMLSWPSPLNTLSSVSRLGASLQETEAYADVFTRASDPACNDPARYRGCVTGETWVSELAICRLLISRTLVPASFASCMRDIHSCSTAPFHVCHWLQHFLVNLPIHRLRTGRHEGLLSTVRPALG